MCKFRPSINSQWINRYFIHTKPCFDNRTWFAALSAATANNSTSNDFLPFQNEAYNDIAHQVYIIANLVTYGPRKRDPADRQEPIARLRLGTVPIILSKLLWSRSFKTTFWAISPGSPLSSYPKLMENLKYLCLTTTKYRRCLVILPSFTSKTY